MFEKQLISYLTKIEQLPLPALEKEIVRLYKQYQNRILHGTEQIIESKIKLCLSKRKRILNSDFVFTPEAIMHFETVNNNLIVATKTLLDKTLELNLQMQQILLLSEGFLLEYDIEASLKVDRQKENTMAEILYEFPTYNELRNFTTNSTSNYIADELDDHNWNEEELSVQKLGSTSHFCYASHVLFCHLYYSYSDILSIIGFRSEVNVCWGNINKIKQ